jgi:endonuclease-3
VSKSRAPGRRGGERDHRRGAATPGVGDLRRRVDAVTRALERAWGTPSPPRRRPDPLDSLIATILSQHTSDLNSARAFGNLKARFPTWDLAANSPTKEIARAIHCGGLADQKAHTIQPILREVDGGSYFQELRRLDDLTALRRLCTLKGVGLKTAACVLLFSLGRDVVPVDVHVHRILRRVGVVHHKGSPEETFERLRSSIRPSTAYSLHINLLRLGRTLCRPSSPRCAPCPLIRHCAFSSTSPSAPEQR